MSNLSYSKMISTVYHKSPRTFDEQGIIMKVPLCTKAGSHSDSRHKRRSNLNQLGTGVTLYLKMLKYFSWYFCAFTILSFPTMWIYIGGDAFDTKEISPVQFLSLATLGNLNNFQKIECEKHYNGNSGSNQ